MGEEQRAGARAAKVEAIGRAEVEGLVKLAGGRVDVVGADALDPRETLKTVRRGVDASDTHSVEGLVSHGACGGRRSRDDGAVHISTAEDLGGDLRRCSQHTNGKDGESLRRHFKEKKKHKNRDANKRCRRKWEEKQQNLKC